MKRLILDTQCLLSAVSGYHQHKSTSLAAIWAAFRRRELILVFSEVSLTEIQRVLDYASVRQLNITSGQAFAAAARGISRPRPDLFLAEFDRRKRLVPVGLAVSQ